MQRRSVLVSGLTGALTSAFAVGRSTMAQESTPTAMAGMPTTNIITADGGLIDPTIGAAGVWTATGERTADFTLIALFAEGGGSYYLVRSSITVDAGGDTATNTFSETHVAPDGTILDQRAQATSAYVRLKVEPQDAVGQPMTGFPAWTPQAAVTPTP